VYRGANNYAKYVEKKDSAFGSAHKVATGPQRAPAHHRVTVRWNYALDICKDFKLVIMAKMMAEAAALENE
jgi:hypothetical protein